jgi:hypothetical protein
MENNELIGRFMGWQKLATPATEDSPQLWWHDNPPLHCTKHQGKFYFDVSWDWLMPVVKKIYDLWENEADEKDWEIYKEVLFVIVSSSIEFLYECVVKFINWYNNEKNISCS